MVTREKSVFYVKLKSRVIGVEQPEWYTCATLVHVAITEMAHVTITEDKRIGNDE